MRVAAKITVNGGLVEGEFDIAAFEPFFLDVAKAANKIHCLWKTNGNRKSLIVIDAACVTTVEVWPIEGTIDHLSALATNPNPDPWAPSVKEIPVPESTLKGKPPEDPGPGEFTLAYLGLDKGDPK